jgi:hypothetical protein
LLVLCDDNVSSGIQSEAQFLSWFGIEKEKWPKETQRERNVGTSALTHAHQVKLRSLRVATAVCSGTANADRRLRHRASVLGIENFLGVQCKVETAPEAAALSPALELFLRQTGSDVLAFCRHASSTGVNGLSPAQQEDCLADALGFGNARGLLATIFNVPTSTLTALWCPGVSRKQAWVPLLMRRGYLRHLVLA